MRNIKRISSVVMTVFLSVTIVGSSSAFALAAPTAKEVADSIVTKNQKVINQLKSDPEVTFIYDDGKGNASFIPSEYFGPTGPLG